jgi:hypothetical protein
MFDVVFVGGTDSSWCKLTSITKRIVEDSFAQYHREGGNVVLLHDVFRNQRPSHWTYFENLIGLHTARDSPGYRRVKQVQPTEAGTALLSRPFKLPESFEVSETHAYMIYAAERAIVGSCDNLEHTYYAECEGIGMSEAGHSYQLTQSEWQFFVNVVCHFSTARPRKGFE